MGGRGEQGHILGQLKICFKFFSALFLHVAKLSISLRQLVTLSSVIMNNTLAKKTLDPDGGSHLLQLLNQ